jgi:hypothetical protein
MRIELKKNYRWRISMIEILQLPLLLIALYFNFFLNPWNSIHVLKFLLATMFLIRILFEFNYNKMRAKSIEVDNGKFELNYVSNSIVPIHDDIINYYCINSFDNILVLSKTNKRVVARINKRDLSKDDLKQLLDILFGWN